MTLKNYTLHQIPIIMKILIPEKRLLKKTGEVDYYDWNYKFPINLVQRYRFRQIVKLLGKKKYSTLLEVGTGSGIFLPELSKYCNDLYACDIHNNYDHIEKLGDYYRISGLHVNRQNIEKTDYPDAFFDVIVAVSVLEFVDNIQNAVQEIKRILKPNGIFLTICPMESQILDTLLSLYATKKPQEEFVNSRNSLRKRIEESFYILEKNYMIPLIGKWFPVYTYYKLAKC
jgi:ubiquinone/menaquinone biosynthesis C-methylase UbiE